jgi:DNA polymerase V
VSVGFGVTKTLAKAANAFAKKSQSGVFVLDDPEALRNLPVGKVWGVGRRYSEWLIGHGVLTAWDLRQANGQWIRQRMSVVGHRTVLELRGQPCIELELAPPAKKNMAYARSFGRLLSGRDELAQAVGYYAERVSAKLRKAGLAARHAIVFLETNPFRAQDPQYRASAHAPFAVATSFSPEIVSKCLTLLDSNYQPGYRHYADNFSPDPVNEALGKFAHRQEHGTVVANIEVFG